MSKHVRYTCNKKNEPVLKKDCERCPEFNPCAKDGKWCFVGALVAEYDPIVVRTSMQTAENVASPILRDTSTITINFGDGMKMDVLCEDMKNKLERDFYRNIGLFYGA